MLTLVRRLRGLVGVAASWAIVWAAVGASLGFIYAWVSPQQVDPGETPLRIAIILGTAGLISGSAFGIMLTLLERNRSLQEISLARVALWGAVGAAAVPLLTQVHDSQVLWMCPLGALLATGSVLVARRGEDKALGDGKRRRLTSDPSEY